MRRRGFTLVEMLVVISLLGIVVGSIGGFMHRSYAHARHVQERIGSDRDSQVAMATLRDDVRSHRVTHAGDFLSLETRDGAVIEYRIEAGSLVRKANDRADALLAGTRALEFSLDDSALRVHIAVMRVVGELVVARDYTRSFATRSAP